MDKKVYEFISQQTNDPIVERKTCAISGTEFAVFQSDLDFYTKISPTFDGVKFPIPTPTLCPEERQKRRLAFRNERNLFRRTCDASGKQIISIYSPDKPYKVYDQKIRWSDSWDPMDYGREFDFSKTFTEQFGELIMDVPMMSLMIQDSENCDYTNLSIGNKDCYFTFGGDFSEKCMYTTYGFYSNSCNDNYRIFSCSECFSCKYLYDSTACQRCETGKNLYKCISCIDCEGCSYCIGCVGLRNQKYMIFNKKCSEEEYKKKLQELKNQKNLDSFFSQFKMFYAGLGHTVISILGSEGCTGSRIINSKNCIQCHEIENGENCRFNFINAGISNSYDVSQAGHNTTWTYNSLGIASSSNILSSNYLRGNNSNIYYSMHCFNRNSNLFGCIGLRNKSYCIFNKQYTKDEYEKTVARIIAHMQTTGERGEFFHPSLSPFGYNETVAQEYFLENKENITDLGYNRSDYQAPVPTSDKTISGQDLPDTIQEVDDTILQHVIACETTGKIFRIQSQELAFYRKHNIPLPRKHPDQRHLERLQLRK